MKKLLQKTFPSIFKEKTYSNSVQIKKDDNTNYLLKNYKYGEGERVLRRYWGSGTDLHKQEFIREVLNRGQAFEFYQSLTILKSENQLTAYFSGKYYFTYVSLDIEEQLMKQIIQQNLEVEMFSRGISVVLSHKAILNLINSITKKGMYSQLLKYCKPFLTEYQIFQCEEAIKNTQ